MGTERPVGRVTSAGFAINAEGLCGHRTLRQRLTTSRSPDPLPPSPGSEETRSGPWKLTGTSTVLGLDWLSPPVDPVLEAARAAPLLPTRKPGDPACLWEGLECPQPGRSAVPRRQSKPPAGIGEDKALLFFWSRRGTNGEGGLVERRGGREAPPRTRSLQANTSELPLQVFLAGRPFFFFCRREPLPWASWTREQAGGEEPTGPCGVRVVARNCSRTLEESRRPEPDLVSDITVIINVPILWGKPTEHPQDPRLAHHQL